MLPLLRLVLYLWLLCAAVHAAEAPRVRVPGLQPQVTGGWYRCWIRPDPSFFTPHERNLFEESAGLHLQDVPGAHEVWLNGNRIGAAGRFPPNPTPATNTFHRHKIPVGSLRRDLWNEIAIRVHHDAGPVGFAGPAPFVMNYFMECALEGEWEFTPDAAFQPGPARTDRPAHGAFDQFRESSRTLARAVQVPGPRLSPAESATRQTATHGLHSSLVLHEPEIAQPFHFSFDARGRLWVTQSRQYPYPAGLTMVSRDKYYRAHYDKVPLAPPHHDRGADRISIHECSTPGGPYDRHRTFLDGLNLASAALPGPGGTWVLHVPYLLFYPDQDADDLPDGPPEVHLAGFGFEDTHAIANGLTWGPDGWIYGTQGSTVSCRVRRPDIDPANHPGVHFEGCMVWRYHPRTRAFEIFAEGGGNTFGLDFDDAGRLYSGHNGGSTRGWHFVQGGFYQMQGVDPGKFGPPRNPTAFGELPMIGTTNAVQRFTHFGTFVGAAAIPPPLQGLLFALDPLRGEVIASERTARGATYVTRDVGVILRSSDPAFRPLAIANAPDGSLLVSDMYEFYIAHGQHYQNQIDPTTGRVHRLAPANAHLESDLNLASRPDTALIPLLDHPNQWHRRTAARLLGERSNPATVPALQALLHAAAPRPALHALWALHAGNRLDDTEAARALTHPSPQVRLWTCRWIGDHHGIHRNLGLPAPGHQPTPMRDHLRTALQQQARREADPEVRAQIAATARRLPTSDALPLLGALLMHGEDAADPFIPLLCWWVLECRLPAEAEPILDFLREPALWDSPITSGTLLPRIARRLALDGRRQDLLHLAGLLRRAPGRAHQARLLAGFEEAYRGRALGGIPAELLSAIAEAGGGSVALRLRQGDPRALSEALAMLRDGKMPADQRIQVIRVLGDLAPADAAATILEIALGPEPADLRRAALAALATWNEPGLGTRLATALPGLPADLRPAALNTLLQRPGWVEAIGARLRAGAWPEAALTRDLWDRLRTVPSLRTHVPGTIPASLANPGDTPSRLATDPGARGEQERIERVLRAAPGDPYAGEATYLERCAGCHRLFFKGGNVGPDLTPYQRDNLGTLLPSLLRPDAEIREGYQYLNVETRDGRSLGGFAVERDGQVLVLRGLDGQDVTLAATNIVTLQPAGRSLMPEGLLEGLTDAQLRNFFAYLRISQPITR